MDYSEYKHLLFERPSDGVLLIKINRPERHKRHKRRTASRTCHRLARRIR